MKKGQLEASQVIGLVMAIVGFIIVLILLFSIGLDDYTDEEVCHASVLSRASLPSAVQGNVPLKCTTRKICITEGIIGGKCEQFIGEKNVEYVKLSGTNEEKADEIARVNAEAMYSCWNMMGQGKLDLFADTFKIKPVNNVANFLNTYPKSASCVICSRVAIDQDINSLDEIQKNYNFQEYLAYHGPEGSDLSYLNLFTDKQVNAFPSSESIGEDKIEIGDKTSNKEIDEIAIVFAQIKTDETPKEAFVGGAIVTTSVIGGGVYALGGTGLVTKAFIANPLLTGAAALLVVGGTAGIKAAGAYRDQGIAATYCDEFKGEDAKNSFGCSIIAPIDYDNIQKMNEFCQVIEGNP